MTKIFGFLMAVAMSAGFANAALLAKWDFGSGPGGAVSPGVAGQAGDFKNYGTTTGTAPAPNDVYGNNGGVSGGQWVTSAIRRTATNFDVSKGSEFRFENISSAPPKIMVLQTVTLNAEMLAVNLTDVNQSTLIRAYGSVNGGAYTALGNVSVGIGTIASLLTINVGQNLNPGDFINFRFVYQGSRGVYDPIEDDYNTTTAQFKIDNISLNGTDNVVVPEPATVACFAGLLGVGAFRRLRKRD